MAGALQFATAKGTEARDPMRRRSGPQQRRWRVALRGELLGHVWVLTFPAACERAVRRWRISAADQQELVVEQDDKGEG
jgi:hypothetical protein